MIAGIALGLAFFAEGVDRSDPAALRQRAESFAGPIGIFGVIVGGVAVAVSELSRRRRSDPAVRRAIGLRAAAPRFLVYGLASGAAVAVAYMAAAITIWRPDTSVVAGPLGRMAMSGGWRQLTWTVAGLAISPPLEEFLFRGVLLAGFASAWGIGAAAVLSTLLFTALHVTELSAYPPATFGIVSMSAVAIALRVRTGSLAPPIAAHFGYNLALAALVATAQAWAR